MAESVSSSVGITEKSGIRVAAQLKFKPVANEMTTLTASMKANTATGVKWFEKVTAQKAAIAALEAEEKPIVDAIAELARFEDEAQLYSDLVEAQREDRNALLVRFEHSKLELALATSSEKKAIVIAKATERAAAVQGKAWCLAKQSTADAEYNAVMEKRRLTNAGGIAPIKVSYNVADWRSCLGVL